MNKQIEALYIHIPFCHQMCHYCDFAKMYVNDQIIERYMHALSRELQLKLDSDIQFSSIYIGGGTPSVLSPSDVKALFNQLQGHIQAGAEITFEMNPEDVTKAYIEMLLECGVNRVSLGVQSFSDELIQRVGRNHSSQKSQEAIAILKASQMQNITVDLMFALPGQTLDDVKNDIAILQVLNLPHISLYSLILEERTRLYIQQADYQFVDEDMEAEMYAYIIASLQEMGYTQYEMSNFSQSKQFESRHNLAYWHQKAYHAVGLGAHAFIDNVRIANTKSINTYINQLEQGVIPVYEQEVLTEKQLFEEFCFLAFRDCQRGLDLRQLKSKYEAMYNDMEQNVANVLQTLQQQALIEQYDCHQYRLTVKGRMLANEVFQAFIQL